MIENLTVGQFVVRRRWDKRIRKCGGCNVPLNTSVPEAPQDIVLLQKAERPNRDTSWRDNDLMKMNVHCHVSKKCLKTTGFVAVTVIKPKLLILTNEHKKYFNTTGVKLPEHFFSK